MIKVVKIRNNFNLKIKMSTNRKRLQDVSLQRLPIALAQNNFSSKMSAGFRVDELFPMRQQICITALVKT